jgi:uncharacterized protein (TIGR01777 family)
MKRIITGATGLVGKRLVAHWLAQKVEAQKIEAQKIEVVVVGRSKAKLTALFGDRVQALEWNELNTAVLANAEVVVNLAGEGLAEKRWSEERKRVILESRLDTTSLLVKLLAPLKQEAPALFSASAIGVYGLQAQTGADLPPRLDESMVINFDTSNDFLSRVARAWEKATLPAKESGVRVVNMRFGVVLAREGGALPQLARPFYFYMGGPIASGQQAVSWVSIEDLIAAIDFLLKHTEISGPVNIVAPGAVSQRELAGALGEALHRPAFMPMPALALQILVGEMANELLIEGQNIYPQRLLQAGFHFSAPYIQTALQKIYS